MRQSGLSLLELLVSIVLMALIAAFLSNALSLSSRVEEASRTASIQMEREATAVAALRSILEVAAVPARDQPRTAFTGDTKRIAFAAALPTRLSGGGLLKLEIDCEGEDGIAASWRRPAPREDSFRDLDWAETLTLWPGAACRNIAYFGLLEQTSGGSLQWHQAWPETSATLPHIVRFEIIDSDDTEHRIHIAPQNVTLLAAASAGER